MKVVARISFVIISVFLSSVFIIESAMGGLPKGKGPLRKLSKAAIQSFEFFDANRIGSWVTNVGELVSFRKTNNSGMIWPRGTTKTINFTSGIWIGGLVEGKIRTAVAEYVVEFVPGTFKAVSENISNQDDERFRVYVISKEDFAVADPGVDFLEWPFEDGAPFVMDSSGNPIDKGGNIIDRSDYENMVPLLIGDKTYWSVSNDLDITAHTQPFNTPPLGVELHQMLWGFNRADAFGDMMFMKYTVINKGINTIDSVYLSFWADVDIGDANDDLVGSDTLLSLGYSYNETGSDAVYGPKVPAIGYDFFQGPIVPSPGDTAKVSSSFRSSGIVPDFKNLPMTSFAHYVNNAPAGLGDPETAFEMYNFQQRLDGLGKEKIDPTTNLVTKFSFTGDPITGEGWILETSADMRFLMSSGPFTLAPGDTQELVGGIIIAQGDDALSSLEKLKKVDEVAQIAYDIDFALPASPDVPETTIGALPNQIVLSWKPNSEIYDVLDQITLDDDGNQTRYKFQGYNIYQTNGPVDLASLKIEKLATFDLVDGITNIKDLVTQGIDVIEVTVQEDKDSGIQSFIRITEDVFTKSPLINFRKYYFIVEAYGYNPFGLPKILTSPREILVAVPGPPPGGTKLEYDTGDTLGDFDNPGVADVDLLTEVVDPNLTKTKDYTISFFTDSLNTNYWWSLYDETEDSVAIDSVGIATVIENKTLKDITMDVLLTDLGQFNLYDGLRVVIDGTYKPAVDIIEEMTRQTYADPTDITTSLNFIGTSTNPDAEQGARTSALLNGFNPNVAMGGDQPELFRGDLELRITGTGNGSMATRYDWMVDLISEALRRDSLGTLVEVPWQLWDVEYRDPATGKVGRQINALFIDNKDDRSTTDGFLSIDSATGVKDVVIAVYSAYDGSRHTTYDESAAWMLYFGQSDSIGLTNENVTISAGYSVGDKYFFKFNNHIVPAEDTLRFKVKAPDFNNDESLQSEIAQINVFPNPYFGQNLEEIDSFNRFVTFTHLPVSGVTIRIFTVAGHLVNKIIHDNGTSMEKWDLTNRDRIPIASGMYIAHIDLGGGLSKILKLAVFIPEERLDLF